MRIDPKPFTLDALERATIVAALQQYADAKTRLLNNCRGTTEKSRRTIEQLETARARAEDLLGAMRD